MLCSQAASLHVHALTRGAHRQAWICNSSICMTKRGLKPTGIAIFEAKGMGYASVAHFVQARPITARLHREEEAMACIAPRGGLCAGAWNCEDRVGHGAMRGIL